MEQDDPVHERVRFRRDEIVPLDSMPSAGAELHPEIHVRPRRSGWSLARSVVLAAILGPAAFLAIAFLLVVSGFGSDSLRREAEAAIGQFTGIQVSATMGSPHFSIDASNFVGVELRDVSLATLLDGAEIIKAGAIRFGIRFKPLLSGEFKLGSASIADARIVPAAFGAEGPRDWTASLVDERGLIDPDKVSALIFESAHRAFRAFEARATRSLAFENVEIVLPPSAHVSSILIESAELTQTGNVLKLTGLVAFDGRKMAVEGAAERDDSGRIASLDLRFSGADLNFAFGEAASGAEVHGGVRISLTGAESVGESPDMLAIDVNVDEAEIGGDPSGPLKGSASLRGVLVEGSKKIEIERALFTSGRTRLDFNGAFGPSPADADPSAAPHYRFELVSNESVLAPEGSPEPALDFAARLGGSYDAARRIISADEIAVRTGPGEAIASARIDFEPGKRAPALDFTMSIPSMPVSHAKQIWPWLAARGARNWVLSNVFAGSLSNSRLTISVPAGRMGNGVPFTEKEMRGRFEVAGTRFDVAGRIPPVRDAVGAVDITGTHVAIGLDSGTVYMGNDRIVSASEGHFEIPDSHKDENLVGKLDIKVAGDAQSVALLSSYEPIDGMRRLGFAPDDFSGQVNGRVIADIPLKKNADFKGLAWQVQLDYRDMAVAKSFDGQKVTGANGTLLLDPTRAVIDARGKLNGVNAEIDMVVPIGDSPVKRSREIVLDLDEAGRKALAPGLDTVLTGRAKVALKLRDDGAQDVDVDLANAKLSLPWVGWSKGAGVAAKASFRFSPPVNGVTELRDFRLSGKSFEAAGSITLANGSLSALEFGQVRLNRGDDFRVSLKRSSGNYAVTVRGASVDARSIVRQVLSDTGGAESGIEGTGVVVDASVSSVTGFGDERLNDVRIAYSGTGATVGSLTISAMAKSGGRIEIENAGGAARSVSMTSSDAGAILRFLDIYPHMRGGSIRLALKGGADGALRGQVDARDFLIVNEPRLASLVSSRPAGTERSLSEAVRKDIDTSAVSFERGFSLIEKGSGYLVLDRGVLRGPLIGSTFQGTFYDRAGNMDMTGTFMPAYGLNRLFAEIPLIGQILGNGRDRGLIGITFRLAGDAKSPDLQINPLSVIAPGIFRSIFEFN